MIKKSKITNLLVVPLIASAVLLANPVFAASPAAASRSEVRHKTDVPHSKRGIIGTVTSSEGDIIKVTAKDNTQYTVDASDATIMKVSGEPQENPDIVSISDIKVGDAIVVRGEIDDQEINAEKIFEGDIGKGQLHKHLKHWRARKQAQKAES